VYNENIAGELKAQTLYFESRDGTAIKYICDTMLTDLVLPSMSVVTVSDDKYAGIHWDRELTETVWYTPYGRFFSVEEMMSGANVALLGTNFISKLDIEHIDSIWETGIDINNTRFDAIGNFFFNWEVGFTPDEVYRYEPIPSSIVVPLKAYFNLGLSPYRLRCVFAEPLTNAQITHLTDLILPSNSIHSLNLPEVYNASAISNYLSGVAPYMLGVVLSLLSIISVILYWLRGEFVRYKVYMICGAKGRQIGYLLSLNILWLVTISYACSCLVMFAIRGIIPVGIISSLPWFIFIMIYFGGLFLSILAVGIRAIPLVLHEEMIES
jgi:hypothetical protein